MKKSGSMSHSFLLLDMHMPFLIST